MPILGLSSFKHDTAAAILEDGIIKAAIENDKLVRSHSTGLPDSAIRFCLEKAGTAWHDLQVIAVASRPAAHWVRRSLMNVRLLRSSPIAALLFQANELGIFAHQETQVRLLRQDRGEKPKIINFDHHLCHAASAFYLSPFDRALIITMDEEGDGISTAIAVGEGTRIRVLRTIPFPHSMAWMYTQISELLGFTPHHDEHKTQWLSLEGKPVFKDLFLDMLHNPRNHLPRLNDEYIARGDRIALSGKLYRELGLREHSKELGDDMRRALASSFQAACVEIVASTMEYFAKREGIDKYCLAGGLFQNSLLVAALEGRVGNNQIYVPPAPGNPGCALGAGMLVYHSDKKVPRLPAVFCIYGGPSCERSEVKEVLDNCKARYSLQLTEERKLEAVVELFHSGKIVGWVQGPAEFGPRALGNRSLLASPWAPYIKENLNDYIKHREWFRPFAIAVPEEDAGCYFEYSELCQSMNSLGTVRPGTEPLLDGFVLPGKLLRLQVVRRQTNPLFWRLLKRFGEGAPAPMLVNTSFNLFGEPLVVRPRDAIRSYFCSGIDALLIDNFLLSKSVARASAVAGVA